MRLFQGESYVRVRPRLGDDGEVQWVRSKSRSQRYPDILTSDNLVRILVRRSCTKVTYWIYRHLLFHWDNWTSKITKTRIRVRKSWNPLLRFHKKATIIF